MQVWSTKKALLSLAAKRGFNGDAFCCVVEHDGERVLVDTESVCFPHASGRYEIAPPKCRAGTELHALIRRFGISDSSTCKCNARVSEMNRNGCEWCENNIDRIVGWLRESAAERGLPFLDAAGRMLVLRAIRNARRNATS